MPRQVVTPVESPIKKPETSPNINKPRSATFNAINRPERPPRQLPSPPASPVQTSNLNHTPSLPIAQETSSSSQVLNNSTAVITHSLSNSNDLAPFEIKQKLDELEHQVKNQGQKIKEVILDIKDDEFKKFENRLKEYEEQILSAIEEHKRPGVRQSIRTQHDQILEQLTDNTEKQLKIMQENIVEKSKLQEEKEELQRQQKIIRDEQINILAYHLANNDLKKLENCLVQFKFNANAYNDDGQTLLHLALDKNIATIDEETVIWLLKKVNSLKLDKNAKSAKELFLAKNSRENSDVTIQEKYDRILAAIAKNEDKMTKLPQKISAVIDSVLYSLVATIRTTIIPPSSLPKPTLKKALSAQLTGYIRNHIHISIMTLNKKLLEEDRVKLEAQLKQEERIILEAISKIFKHKSIEQASLDLYLPLKKEIVTEKASDKIENKDFFRVDLTPPQRKGSFGNKAKSLLPASFKKLLDNNNNNNNSDKDISVTETTALSTLKI